MIKTLSPFYKNIPWLSPSSGIAPDKYILNIYIWSGLKASVPIVPNYEIENINPLGRVGSSKVDISRFIKGFLTDNLITNTTLSLNDGNSLVWVKTEVIYYINGVAQSPEFEEIDSAINGYSYGIEGENPQLNANNDLITRIEQKVSLNSIYLFPFLASETESTEITIQSENVTVNLTKTATTDSNELVQVVYIKCNEFDGDYIEIYKDELLINTLLLTDEPKYTPLDIVFKNKQGQLQTLTLFKEKIDKLNIESETYESSSGQPLNGVHQFNDYNITGRTSFSVNSGFVKEDNNEIFKQLFLSSKIWNLKDGVYIPLNLDGKSLEYKSRNKDRLINYKLDFKYSYNEINNI